MINPQQQALLSLAQMQGSRPPTTPGGRNLRFSPEPMTDAEDIGQLESAGAAGITPKGMNDQARMSRWDTMAAPEPAAPVAPRAPVLPRVDIATSMAVAADRARTGKSLDELYRERGYDTTGSDEGFMSNLRSRAKQGDAKAWQKLAFLAPGETPEALLTGTRREKEGRMLRFAQENARRTADKEEAANAAAQSARASELDAGRRHQVSLTQMQIDAQQKATQAQADYNNKKLAIEEMAARGQIDAARAAQEMAKAQNERNNQLAEAQIGMQRQGLEFEKLKFKTTADQADPMGALKRTAMEASIAQAADQGTDPMVAFNRFAQAGATPQTAGVDATVPVTKDTMEAARQDMLGATDTRSVAEVLAKYLPMMEGRPQFSQQLMAIAKARVPDIETKMQAIAQYGQSNAAQGVEKMENLPWIMAPMKWGTALGRKTSAGLGLMPDVTVADAKRFGNTWNRISQPQPTR
jgi:hypothetical protein